MRAFIYIVVEGMIYVYPKLMILSQKPIFAVTDTDFNWQEACIQREDKYQRWKLYEENMEFYRFTRGLYAPVDTVHFMKVNFSFL